MTFHGILFNDFASFFSGIALSLQRDKEKRFKSSCEIRQRFEFSKNLARRILKITL